ncbi:MAG: hypothetical protein MRZ89_03410 [Lachnospiraceae bacterium]|nr:hypothetical protein [Lachnospiraceae bacterium]
MIGNPQEIIQWLFEQNKDKRFEVKEYHKKRSLNANAYAWALIGKIADVLRSSKDEVYLEMLKKYGQSEIVSVLSDINVTGYFKYFEEIATVKLQGKNFTHYKVFKGTSEYNTAEMAVFIDGVISEAEELGIDTLPPDEVKKIKSLWGEHD